MAASSFQTVALVASPSYPNAIAWSDENLVAVASGHIVTILKPAMPFGPRGIITVPASKPFDIGIIEKANLFSDCLLPTCLSRDDRPHIRSISWSPVGLASNGGCLLAVCTADGRVKLYRFPFCEFSVEWIEVLDVSEMLYTYLKNMNYGELDVSPPTSSDCRASELGGQHLCNDDQPIGYLLKSRGQKAKKVPANCSVHMITAAEYASRSAMLSSVVAMWSPVLQLASARYALLAIGSKAGRISLWRIHDPQSYSVARNTKPTVAVFTGLLRAHDSWITAISWVVLTSDVLNHQLLLATGSSDGSVKIWRAYSSELLKTREDSKASFSLLKEVIDIDYVPVSVLSLLVPAQSQCKIILAVGKGSGALEIWICDMFTNKADKVGLNNAHDHMVTGLAWSFDGSCLYSCGQDNSLHGWMLHGNSASEVSIPPNILGVETSVDVPNAFESCFGLAVSPSNMVVAVVHSLDSDQLNPMYQARSQKAAVEYFWIGGQELNTSSSTSQDFDAELFPGFPDMDMAYWGYNILRSLNQCAHLDMDKPLVIWDIVAALLAFKQKVPNYAEDILIKWLNSLLGTKCGSSPESILPHTSTLLSNLTSRQLHLLNIVIRRVILSDLKSQTTRTEDGDVKPPLWSKLLEDSEKQLRERLISCSFSAAINLLVHSSMEIGKPGCWHPVGLAQMERWISMNEGHLKDHLKVLASEVRKHEKRIRRVCNYVAEEQCSYCSAPVPFEQTEYALCQGVKCGNGVGPKHKLARCAVTMQVCPVTPSWFCMCCRRWVSNLPPKTHFTLQRYPDNKTHTSTIEVPSKPFCPFCGILLQRLQPDFLLSASPV